MKKTVYLAALMVLAFCSMVFAIEFADIAQHGLCKHCGMNREMFAHSRMQIEYDDGTDVGLCSLRCAAVEFSGNLDKTPQMIRVADRESKQLLDVEKAVWLLGGDLPGVMTTRAKWAFADRASAETFQQTHGGELVGFEAAIKASYEDMYQDTRMIREKRKMKKLNAQ